MNQEKNKQSKAFRRHARVRMKISGLPGKPRLSVFRSNRSFFAQLIDDTAGKTLVSVSGKEINNKATKTEQAGELGKILAEKALKNKIVNVVFDKGSYKFHGRVKAFAEGAREGGLKF
jgi:large subunit ribosomal protein L18